MRSKADLYYARDIKPNEFRDPFLRVSAGIPLHLVYSTQHCKVISRPAGLVVEHVATLPVRESGFDSRPVQTGHTYPVHMSEYSGPKVQGLSSS